MLDDANNVGGSRVWMHKSAPCRYQMSVWVAGWRIETDVRGCVNLVQSAFVMTCATAVPRVLSEVPFKDQTHLGAHEIFGFSVRACRGRRVWKEQT